MPLEYDFALQSLKPAGPLGLQRFSYHLSHALTGVAIKTALRALAKLNSWTLFSTNEEL